MLWCESKMVESKLRTRSATLFFQSVLWNILLAKQNFQWTCQPWTNWLKTYSRYTKHLYPGMHPGPRGERKFKQTSSLKMTSWVKAWPKGLKYKICSLPAKRALKQGGSSLRWRRGKALAYNLHGNCQNSDITPYNISTRIKGKIGEWRWDVYRPQTPEAQELTKESGIKRQECFLSHVFQSRTMKFLLEGLNRWERSKSLRISFLI